MTPDIVAAASLTEIASFAPGHFLENLAVRKNGSILVTVAFHRELWCISPRPDGAAKPVRLHSFDLAAMGIVEAEPDIFYVSATSVSRGCLYRFDLRDWAPGRAVEPTLAVNLPSSVGMLNGSSLLAPGVMVLADSFASKIWRVDLTSDGRSGTVREWLSHDSMAHHPRGPMPDQPGVNGVRYASKTRHLYYTSTAQQLLMRVPVDPRTLAPVGEPERVAHGMMWDDFCIDEDNGFAYVTTHRQNSIERISLVPATYGDRRSVAGVPFTEQLLGPTSMAWSRNPGDYGRVAYVTTDGGIKAPMPDRVLRPSKVLRMQL